MAAGSSDASVGTLFASCEIIPASMSAGKGLLAARDTFVSAQSTFDRQSRVNIPLDTMDVSMDVYLAFVAAQAMDWTVDEIAALGRIVHSLRPKLDRFTVSMPKAVYLVKTTGKEEGYAAYTRHENVIVVPANMAASLSASTSFGDPLHPTSQDAYLEAILTHELFHIISKNNSSLRRQLYQLINYQILDNEIVLPDTPWGASPSVTMRDLKITNPDGPKLDVAIEMDVAPAAGSEPERMHLVPVLLSSKPYGGGSLFDSLEWWFIAVRRDDEGNWVPTSGDDGGPVMVSSSSVIDQYKDLVGHNFTQEIFHPDEILAQTFVLSANQPSNSLVGDVNRCLASALSFEIISIAVDEVEHITAHIISGVNDPIPLAKYPSFQPVATKPPYMPHAFSAIALLHPFSPPLSTDPTPKNPFFQLSLARIDYSHGDYFSAQIVGCEYGSWWYVVTKSGTQLSIDQGKTWAPVDMGWALPSNWFAAAAASATSPGSSPLNWLVTTRVDWWKALVPHTAPPAAIWMWFNPKEAAPVRMMFGQGPPSPTKGNPSLLALFQMYSFTYITQFDRLSKPRARADLVWTAPSIPGFAIGNPKKFKRFVWNGNFGMTVFMTPVNGLFNPLPTRVLYVWKPDDEYSIHSDRSQHTLMRYDYNPRQPPPPPPLRAQIALLTGPAPDGVQPPPDSGTGFLISHYANGTVGCVGGSKFSFPQQPPDWISIPAVESRIRATIMANPVLCPGRTVTLFSVLFPPSPPNYPEATYLWTWYAPENHDGTDSRPVTFMQSQSGVGVGTSLALADYFYYENFSVPIDPSNFVVPGACSSHTRKSGLRHIFP